MKNNKSYLDLESPITLMEYSEYIDNNFSGNEFYENIKHFILNNNNSNNSDSNGNSNSSNNNDDKYYFINEKNGSNVCISWNNNKNGDGWFYISNIILCPSYKDEFGYDEFNNLIYIHKENENGEMLLKQWFYPNGKSKRFLKWDEDGTIKDISYDENGEIEKENIYENKK